MTVRVVVDGHEYLVDATPEILKQPCAGCVGAVPSMAEAWHEPDCKLAALAKEKGVRV